MIALEAHPQGTVLPVRASPGARTAEIRGAQDGALKVCVTQAAERGKANRAIRLLLSKELRLRRSQIELMAGDTSPQKRYLIRDVSPEQLAARIRQLV